MMSSALKTKVVRCSETLVRSARLHGVTTLKVTAVRTTNPADQCCPFESSALRRMFEPNTGSGDKRERILRNKSFIVCGRIETNVMYGTCSTCGEGQKCKPDYSWKT
jgi:hypothetical protein